MMVTQYDLDCIYWDADPPAKEAFERLARDHGQRFAEQARDYIMSCKLIDMNMEAIAAIRPIPSTQRHENSDG